MSNTESKKKDIAVMTFLARHDSGNERNRRMPYRTMLNRRLQAVTQSIAPQQLSFHVNISSFFLSIC
jgi:hypothetical protein